MTPAPWDASQPLDEFPMRLDTPEKRADVLAIVRQALTGYAEEMGSPSLHKGLRIVFAALQSFDRELAVATELRDAVRREGEAQEQFANELRAERDELLAVVAQLRGQADAWEMVYQTLMRIEPTFANNDFKSTTQSAVDFIEWQERTRQELLGKLHQVAIDAAMAPEAPDET